jgi:hypothetical protein
MALIEDNWLFRSIRMKCGLCLYFVPKQVITNKTNQEILSKYSNIGRCRRHAPALSGWPIVMNTDWCGDFKLNEETYHDLPAIED